LISTIVPLTAISSIAIVSLIPLVSVTTVSSSSSTAVVRVVVATIRRSIPTGWWRGYKPLLCGDMWWRWSSPLEASRIEVWIYMLGDRVCVVDTSAILTSQRSSSEVAS